ncbi:MAG: hypothetical protein P4K83_06065 [Terracidiphilus sp.]|nr:hypothetical protein [Terracidiphilus sp.]
MKSLHLACALLAASLCAFAQNPPTPAADRASAWRTDLDLLARTFRGETSEPPLKDFERLYPPSTFNVEIGNLKRQARTLSDEELTLGLMHLVASAHVAHNSVASASPQSSTRLPFSLEWIGGHLVIVAATGQYADLNGAEVLRFGPLSSAEFLNQIAPYVSYESRSWLLVKSGQYMVQELFLRHFHLVEPDGRVLLTLRHPGSTEFTRSVPFVDFADRRIPFAEARHLAPNLAESHPGAIYWSQYLPDSGTYFIQYNACREDPKLPFGRFVSQVAEDLDSHTVRRVVVDLRRNSGGNSEIVNSLIAALGQHSRSTGKIYVLIGPTVFSSGVLDAGYLHRRLKAVLAGEPTGGVVDSYGELSSLKLSASGTTVYYSTKHFGAHEHPKGALKPSLPTMATYESFLAHRDLSLEAVLAAK